MMTMFIIERMLRDRRGVSTIEYAVLAFAIIAIVGGVTGVLGGAFTTVYANLATEISSIGQ
jgi:Flp pilus assembly pilin Flp